MSKCPYCCLIGPPYECCNEEQPSGCKYICSRPKGHTGEHIACGAKHDLARWPNESAEVEEETETWENEGGALPVGPPSPNFPALKTFANKEQEAEEKVMGDPEVMRGFSGAPMSATAIAAIRAALPVGQRVFTSGATRNASEGKGRFDLLPPYGIREVAKVFERGIKDHGERNWEKGIALSVFLDSGLRHLGQWMEGATDEDHLAAAAWNILCALDTRVRCEEARLPMSLVDIPSSAETNDE